MTTKTDEVLAEVREERERQDAKWGEQNHPMIGKVDGRVPHTVYLHHASATSARTACERRHAEGHGSYFDILYEEFCEAHDEAIAEAERGDGDESATRAELVQVVAVGVAMIEAIDRRKARRIDRD